MPDKSSASKNIGLNNLPPWLIVVLFLVVVAVSWWRTSEPGQPVPAVSGKATQPAPVVDESSENPVENPQAPVRVEVAEEPTDRPATAPARRIASPSKGQVRESAPAVKPGGPTKAAAHSATRIEKQIIRDQNGRVVFEGAIDLRPTLDRIRRGDRNTHRNDGTTFQNRERRLPAKPAGYYKEYVHPTPGLGGPGPQRIIIGQQGETWYTPDHYQTFQRME